MDQPTLEVADIFRTYGQSYCEETGYPVSAEQLRVMHAIEICRTAALGGHVEQCDQCGHRTIAYNSCRNRHCPKCQSLAKARWLAQRRTELLPVEYYHVVFTLPEALAPLALQNKKVLYDILFQAAAQTLLTIAADSKHLGAKIGFLAILHTWGQKLLLHPHLHCVVPGGGLSVDEARWISCRPGFFLPVRVLSRRFRNLFLAALEQAFAQQQLAFHGKLQHLAAPKAFAELVQTCRKTEWVVYAKPPFGGPDKVLDYLGRYTHRIAISNHRLRSMDNGTVTFTWKDYKRRGQQRTLAVTAHEFIRRFLLHVLPDGFVRIRYFGLFANRQRAATLQRCRERLAVPQQCAAPVTPLQQTWQDLLHALTGNDLTLCPICKAGHLKSVETLPPIPTLNPRAPPTGNKP